MRSQLQFIRPLIDEINFEIKMSGMELFQNRTVRPILRFQNSLILSVFNYHIEKNKISFYQLPDIKKNQTVDRIVQNDRKTYHLFLGIVIGHFMK